MAAFVVNDICTKLALADANVAQIMAIRNLFSTLLLLGIAAFVGALRSPAKLTSGTLTLRTLFDIGATISYIVALGYMPLANASAIFQAMPLAVTLGAALFYRETVGWRRWTAITVGFAGVLIIVRPGAEGFNIYSLYVLACVVFSAGRDLLTRRVPKGIPALMISASTAAAVSLTGWLMIPFWGWEPLHGRDVAIMAVSSVAIAIGYICIVEAMRGGDIGFVSPFRYTILIFAIVFGLLIFDEVPDTATLIGATIVVGSGGYSLYRERKRGRRTTMPRAQVH